MTETALGWWGVPLAVFAGAMRSSTPFLVVSLGGMPLI
jgi:general nucleoside transport system permease protein